MLKISVKESILTPTMNVWQSGYVQRTHESEGVHDDLGATSLVLNIDGKKMIWCATDLIMIDADFKSLILKKLEEKGIQLNPEDLIIGGSHNHSAPSVDNGPRKFSPCTLPYVEECANDLVNSMTQAYNAEGIEVEVYYTNIVVDGIYSNRNDADKLSDKKVHLLKFMHGEEMICLFAQLSCHNTVLGPLNYQITGELFGNLRRQLEKDFNTTVMVAQGNAGDMGNRQYRKGQDFEELECTVSHLAAQIRRKITGWKKIDMKEIRHTHVCYDRTVVLDSSIYDAKIARYEKMLETETDLTARKVMLSGIAGFKMKQAMGDGERTFHMGAEIYSFGDLIIVNIPGELGSVLGMYIKEHSPKTCILWGYANDGYLGYMVDKEAYELECQETNVTVYPAGVPEEYVEYITEKMNEFVG